MIPEPFRRKIALDTACAEDVVDIELIRQRRLCRRECQVFIISSAPTKMGPGSPVAMAA